jgi:chlorobactene glucosyltransferase
VLVHATAATALVYVARCASFAGKSLEIDPLREERPHLPSLSIVVPARNEERSIERCVRSLLAQEFENIEVIVVDDRSSDATAAILERLSAEDSRLRVVRGAELPAGWIGKPWALHQGTLAARGEWLLFTDADSYHEPWASRSALAYAIDHGYDAVTLVTGQDLESLAERAFLPSILGTIVLASGAPDALNDPLDADHALANGQYILVSRRALEALGGHAALRGEIAEDVAFARRLKRDGRFHLALVGGQRLCRVRMYTSAREIWEGFTKNVYFGAEGRLDRLVGGVAFLSALSIVPGALAVRALARRRWLEAAELLASLAAISATSGWAMGEVGIERRLGIYAPAGFAFFAAIMANSTWRVLSGRGVEWRGRTYGAASGNGAPQPHP